MTEPARLRDEELADLFLRAYLEVQTDLEAKGAVPTVGGNLLTRYRSLFEFLGAMQLGLLTACLAIMLNFVIVVLLLHLDLSRYMGFLMFRL